MKRKYLNSQSFDSLVKQSKSRPVPEVNVRSRVREALSSDRGSFRTEISIFEIIDQWFSGVRGGVIAASMAAVLLVSGVYASVSFSEWARESEEDPVDSFIVEQNWEDFL